MCIHIYLHKKDIVTTHVFVSQYVFLHKAMAMSAAFVAQVFLNLHNNDYIKRTQLQIYIYSQVSIGFIVTVLLFVASIVLFFHKLE